MKRSSNSQSDAADSDNLITNHKKQKVEVKQESKQDVIEERENDVDDNDKVSNIPVESSMTRKKCPYLDTVCRQKLDFDQQKVCSVTLTNLNVYACLVCGKYFHGKRKDTPAYIHSVQMGHFVFINLQDTRTVCLPDGYEVIDAALNDVKSCLSPKYDAETITHLSSNVTLARDVYGVSYLPGFVGLNNLSRTDYINVILHALSHVAPLRDFCLQDPLPGTDMRSSELYKYPVLKTFVEIVRKMWSSSNFKSVISPAEFVHALSTRSERRFAVGKRMEVSELFNWLIQEFHRNMLGIHKDNRGKIGSKAKEPFKSIMHDIFQGEVEVKTVEGAGNEPDSMEPSDMKAQRMPFNMLSLDIPAAPLFRNSQGATVIPQVPLQELLRKFDGRSWTDKVTETGPCRKQYVIRRLPRFLVLHLARFASSGLGGQTGEKNATIVTFPVKNLEMKEYLQLDQTSTFPLPNAETINGRIVFFYNL